MATDPNSGEYAESRRRVLVNAMWRLSPIAVLDWLSEDTPESREAREFLALETTRKAALRHPEQVE